MTNESFPLTTAASTKHNNSVAELVELAVRGNEGQLAQTGALVVETGEHTGRSARDKYIVRDETTENSLWWENNQAISPEQFARLYDDFTQYAGKTELFVQDLFAGADPS